MRASVHLATHAQWENMNIARVEWVKCESAFDIWHPWLRGWPCDDVYIEIFPTSYNIHYTLHTTTWIYRCAIDSLNDWWRESMTAVMRTSNQIKSIWDSALPSLFFFRRWWQQPSLLITQRRVMSLLLLLLARLHQQYDDNSNNNNKINIATITAAVWNGRRTLKKSLSSISMCTNKIYILHHTHRPPAAAQGFFWTTTTRRRRRRRHSLCIYCILKVVFILLIKISSSYSSSVCLYIAFLLPTQLNIILSISIAVD
jgi:hypothetical protein